MIKNWKQREQLMDFSSMYDDSNHPSDIDMFYIGSDQKGRDVLIIGEIKFGDAIMKGGQRKLLEHFVNNYNSTAMILYITHHADIEKGENHVSVGECEVEQYYYRPNGKIGRWVTPRRRTTVKEVIDTYRGG